MLYIGQKHWRSSNKGENSITVAKSGLYIKRLSEWESYQMDNA